MLTCSRGVLWKFSKKRKEKKKKNRKEKRRDNSFRYPNEGGIAREERKREGKGRRKQKRKKKKRKGEWKIITDSKVEYFLS